VDQDLRGSSGDRHARRERASSMEPQRPFSRLDPGQSARTAPYCPRCGLWRGELVARLSPQFDAVWGVDVDPSMRQLATSRSAGLPNVTVVEGSWTDLTDPVDLVTMIAVLHHLDAATALRSVVRLLAQGGRFLAVGLAPPRSLVDHAWDLASMVTNPLIGYVKHPWPSPLTAEPPPFPVRDPTLPFGELREVVQAAMPGAVMRHRIAFRHTIAWTKP
jgi:SAM-dependent methyltransferase